MDPVEKYTHILLEVQNWEWDLVAFKELLSKEIILEIQDGNHGSAHPKSSDYVSSGVPFIMANNLVNGTVDIRNCKFIPKEPTALTF